MEPNFLTRKCQRNAVHMNGPSPLQSSVCDIALQISPELFTLRNGNPYEEQQAT